VWSFILVKDFTGSDGVGPYVDWNNAAFCLSGVGPSCTRVTDYAGIKLYLYGISPNADFFTFSLRGGSKSEYAVCTWKRSLDSFNCNYTVNNGTLPTSITPPAGGTSHKTHGPAAPFNPEAAGYIAMQMGNNASPALSKWYRKPLPASRVGNWENAESVSGNLGVGHGAAALTSLGTLIDGGFAGTCNGFNNYVTDYALFNIAGSISVPGAGISPQVILNIPWCSWAAGAHITSSPVATKYQVVTFYKETEGAAFGNCETVDGARAGCGELVAVSTVAPYHIIRLGQHFSYCYNGTSCSDYNLQGHGNMSFDGRNIVFKSNWQNTSSASRDFSVPPSIYMMILNNHVVY
jgi:hypothetical protein